MLSERSAGWDNIFGSGDVYKGTEGIFLCVEDGRKDYWKIRSRLKITFYELMMNLDAFLNTKSCSH